MKSKFLTVAVGIVTILWIIHPLFFLNEPVETSHPVRVYERILKHWSMVMTVVQILFLVYIQADW